MSRGLPVFAVLCLLHCVTVINGSAITFQSSPNDVKQGLTKTLTLNCSLTDTSASTSIIGKRDVTQTTDNVLVLTSLVVTKNGQDVASINSALAAHVMDGSANLQVSGSMAGNSGRTGFLQLTYSDPSLNQTGEFVCEASAVSVSGHSITFSTTVEVSTSTPTVADLVTFVQDLSKKNEDLDKRNMKLDSEVGVLKSEVGVLKNTNAALEQTVSQLKNRSDTMVFFNARISGYPHYASGQDVVFTDVVHNKGNNYNSADGRFTCTVPGYYFFSLGCVSQTDKLMGLELRHNGQVVFTILGVPGHSNQAAANTATLQLSAADVVNIHTSHDSTLVGYYCSFSGHLIEAL